jgi:sorting nexin-1/2
MQLDAEEDDSVFYKPPVEPTARAENRSDDAEPHPAAVVPAEEDDD